jgi:hypothetical protein
MTMGFSENECREAYFVSDKQIDAAIDYLLDKHSN